jgi:hypothetical protein
MNGYFKPYPVGQGNLTKLFLDPHLLNRYFDLEIVALIWQRWYLLQPARPDSNVARSYSYSGFIEGLVSCKRWSHDASKCKFVAENVIPVRRCFGCSTCHCFDSEFVKAWPGRLWDSWHDNSSLTTAAIFVFDQMSVGTSPWDKTAHCVCLCTKVQNASARKLQVKVSCTNRTEAWEAIINMAQVEYTNGSFREAITLGSLAVSKLQTYRSVRGFSIRRQIKFRVRKPLEAWMPQVAESVKHNILARNVIEARVSKW